MVVTHTRCNDDVLHPLHSFRTEIAFENLGCHPEVSAKEAPEVPMEGVEVGMQMILKVFTITIIMYHTIIMFSTTNSNHNNNSNNLEVR